MAGVCGCRFVWRDKKVGIQRLCSSVVCACPFVTTSPRNRPTFAVANGDSLRVSFDLMCITLAAVLGYAAYHVTKAKAVKAKRVKAHRHLSEKTELPKKPQGTTARH